MAEQDAGKPDDIRAAGWMVAVHNDYVQNGNNCTFWLFTRNGRAVKGEGWTDETALNIVRNVIGLPIPGWTEPKKSEEPTREKRAADLRVKALQRAVRAGGGGSYNSRIADLSDVVVALVRCVELLEPKEYGVCNSGPKGGNDDEFEGT